MWRAVGTCPPLGTSAPASSTSNRYRTTSLVERHWVQSVHLKLRATQHSFILTPLSIQPIYLPTHLPTHLSGIRAAYCKVVQCFIKPTCCCVHRETREARWCASLAPPGSKQDWSLQTTAEQHVLRKYRRLPWHLCLGRSWRRQWAICPPRPPSLPPWERQPTSSSPSSSLSLSPFFPSSCFLVDSSLSPFSLSSWFLGDGSSKQHKVTALKLEIPLPFVTFHTTTREIWSGLVTCVLPKTNRSTFNSLTIWRKLGLL